ncbi:SMP-30/gluconolactonase/LRE family protein [Ciceribacter sp. L1K22]|uniref:SMP-30/gluconolactonase/LRE family protein n=1 Tax=Ciceribacter sp. L1K22 TaxID=2820275 RepID=UPI001ABE87A3|nr:SMP-30/gluconolactonase/LRE family protein [Ciceribacter sp. L1K22]MBO3760096.1 SMP-30/gluconolactonase/LRE family protein [Ciceribacter sp. L1K22]
MSTHIRSLLILLVSTLGATSVDARASGRIIEGFKNPESILIDNGRRFVSNIGLSLDPVAHDGDGFISALDADGRIVNLHAFPPADAKLDAPKGMAVLDGRLYVADIDRIVGFDLLTGKQVLTATVPGNEPSLLNDVAARDGKLIVSDTFRGTVYRVDPASGVFTIFADGIAGANGLVWDEKNARVLVVSVGAAFEGGDLYEIDATGSVRKLDAGPHGILDGIVLTDTGSIIVSDWRGLGPSIAGTLTLHEPDGKFIGTIHEDVEIFGPADFTLDTERREMWIPATVMNTVIIAPLPR